MNGGRTGRAILWLGLALLLAAAAPATSPRPVPRPALLPVAPVVAVHPGTRAEQAGLTAVLQEILRAPGEGRRLAIGRSPRPAARPAPGLAGVAARVSTPDNRAPRRGSVCGVRQIRGEAISAIPARLSGCGLTQPVRITEVSGVRLTQAATVDCNTARALNDWVVRGVKPAVGRRGGGLAALKVIASYSCRTRNSQPGAKISEHGKGHALDISGVYQANGDFISMLEGWNRRREGRILRAMHDSACGIFGTVLGPDANRFHRDHLHVDTASYRGGPYCR